MSIHTYGSFPPQHLLQEYKSKQGRNPPFYQHPLEHAYLTSLDPERALFSLHSPRILGLKRHGSYSDINAKITQSALA